MKNLKSSQPHRSSWGIEDGEQGQPSANLWPLIILGALSGCFLVGFSLMMVRDTCLNKSYAQYMGPKVCPSATK